MSEEEPGCFHPRESLRVDVFQQGVYPNNTRWARVTCHECTSVLFEGDARGKTMTELLRGPRD